MRRLLPLLSALLIVGGSTETFALYQLRRGYTKYFLQGTSPAVVTEAARGRDVTLLWYYPTHPNIGAGSLVYVRDADADAFIQRIWEIRGDVSSRVIDEILHFTETQPPVDVDPMVGIPPTVPSSRLFAPYPAGSAGLYFVQFIGPMADEWKREVEATGMIAAKLPVYETVGSLWLNRSLFIGTPEQAARARALDKIQWIEVFHPFMRGPDPGALHPRQFYRFYIEVPAAYRTETLAALRNIGTIRVVDGQTMTIDIVGENWPRLQAYPLLMRLRRAHVPIVVAAAWPHRAAPGSVVRLTGTIPEDATIRFRGVAARKLERFGDAGLRTVVPSVAEGPCDITVEARDGTTTVLVSDSRDGFTVGSPNSPGSLAKGDLIFLDGYVGQFQEGPAYLRAFAPDGALLATTEAIGSGQTRGFAIDGQGFIVTVEGARVDASLRVQRFKGLGYAWELIADRSGNLYAAGLDVGNVVKLSPSGTVISTYPIFPAAFDLAADQCTLFYAGLTSDYATYTQTISVRRYDVCASRQLPDLVSGITTQQGIPIRDLDVSPDGGVFVVIGAELYQFDTSGAVRTVHRIGDGFRFFAFSPDPAIAYVSSWRSFTRLEIATGAMTSIPISLFPGAYELAVYGGWTAARGVAAYAEAPVIHSVDASGIIRGSNFQQGMTVTVNGAAAVAQWVNSTTLRVVFPNGVLPASVVVTNPNGQAATHVIAFDMHDVPALDSFALLALAVLLGAVALARMH